MKRTVALALLGVAAATTAYGQGGIIFGTYSSPYTPVTYDATVSNVGGADVGSADGVTISVWGVAGPGGAAGAMANLGVLDWNTTAEGNNYAGYFGNTQISIAGWNPGETWTFQFRASGSSAPAGELVDEALSVGVLFETAEIANLGSVPPGVPLKLAGSEGFAVFTVPVPEPTSFALAGLGAAALLIFRRRD